MAKIKTSAPALNRVANNVGAQRLCQRPDRRPGVAPPCEDDNIRSPGDYMRLGRPITLPKLRFLEIVR